MTSSDCLKASLHQSPHTLATFSALVSPYLLILWDMSSTTWRYQSWHSGTQLPNVEQLKKNFPGRGKSLARKDFFWPLGESHHFCLSGKGCAFLRSCQLLLLKSCLLQGPCVYGFPYCPKLLAVPGMPAAPSRSPNLAKLPPLELA